MALFKAKERLNSCGLPVKVMPKKLIKTRTTPYVKPIQAATRRGISVGYQRGIKTIVDSVFNNTTLLSVILGYRVFFSLIKKSHLNRNEMRVMVLVGSFNSLQKAHLPMYGFGSKGAYVILDKLVEDGYVQIILKKPICYSLTIKGRDVIKEAWDKFDALMKMTSKTIQRKNTFALGYSDEQNKATKKSRKEEVTSLFTSIQTIKVHKPTKRRPKPIINKKVPIPVWFENPNEL